MNHALALASALSDFISLRSTVSTTFFVFVNFFHRSDRVVFLSAVREATQSSTHCQQLFSTFRFFHSLDALSSLRGVNLVKTTLAVNNFFAASEKNPCGTLSSARRPRRSLCHCQSPLRPALAASVRREKRLWTLSRQRSRHFFSFLKKSSFLHYFKKLKGGFFDASSSSNHLFSLFYRGMRRALACFRCRAVQKSGLSRRVQPLVSLTN